MNKQLSFIPIFGLLLALHLSIGFFTVEANAVFMICALFTILLGCRFSKPYRFDLIDIIAVLYLFYILICQLFMWSNYGSKRIYIIAYSFLLLVVFRKMQNERYNIQKPILLAIIAGSIFEIVVSICQQHGIISNANDNFVYGGSMGNQGALAALFSITIPILLSVSFVFKRTKKYENFYYTILFCLLIMLYFVIVSKSRAAWIACFIGCLFVLSRQFDIISKLKRFFKKTTYILISIVAFMLVVTIVSIALYHFKPDSAIGRLFIWKVSLLTPHDNLFFGAGIDSFYANYGNWQMNYFMNQETTDIERTIADYVTCAYNEFLEIFLEQGVLGVLLFFSLFVFALRAKVHNHISLGAKASLGAVLILSIFTYPFNMPLVFVHTFCMISLLLRDRQNSLLNMAHVAKAAIIGSAIITTIGYSSILCSEYIIRRGMVYLNNKDFDKAIQYFDKVQPFMLNDGLFYFYYASAKYQSAQYEESIKLLQQAEEMSSNPSIYMLLAENYKELEQYDNAIREYYNAFYMIPSHMYPKYQIALLYKQMGKQDDAYKVAQEIIAMPEKVPSQATKTIKEEMQRMIDEYAK